jgi:hypothetical protein
MRELLGPIVRLQIQRAGLKVGEKPYRVYDPAPLLTVEMLHASADGVVAVTAEGAVLDVHHRAHPASRNDGGINGISVGFTAHYDAMRSRYGPHMRVGCAGENVLLACQRRIGFDEAAAGFLVHSPDGRLTCRLGAVTVARPCREFSVFAHGGERVDPEALKATLQYLDGGMRGFYCALLPGEAVPDEITLAVGDLVSLDG